MTVCVAAMAEYEGNTVLIGASDRMVTHGDIEFEQQQRKIVPISSSIALLVAGDLALQTTLLLKITQEVGSRIAKEPNIWWHVDEVAALFHKRLTELKRQLAETAILHPLALDYEKLVSTAISPDLAMQLSKEIFDFQVPAIEAIVFGTDPSGAHIYQVDNTGVTCQDWVGFCAIGSGAWHANSQMMFAEHVKSRNVAETLMLVYTAKRRAEVAPGVGEQTDMVIIGPGLDNSTPVGSALMQELSRTYEKVKVQAERTRKDANASISTFLEEIIGEEVVQPSQSAEPEPKLIEELSSEETARKINQQSGEVSVSED